MEAWNFNQLEAKGAFEAALEVDPACARCWWGVAYALGPGANRRVFTYIHIPLTPYMPYTPYVLGPGANRRVFTYIHIFATGKACAFC